MPIGTIYGFFFGAYVIGLLLTIANAGFRTKTGPERLVRQLGWMAGVTWLIISSCTLIGTYIEVGFGQ